MSFILLWCVFQRLECSCQGLIFLSKAWKASSQELDYKVVLIYRVLSNTNTKFSEFSASYANYTQGPEELHLYARIILRTSYLVKYITSWFWSINLPNASFVNPIQAGFFSFHTLYFSISIFALARHIVLALPSRRVFSKFRARACVFRPPHNRHRQN